MIVVSMAQHHSSHNQPEQNVRRRCLFICTETRTAWIVDGKGWRSDTEADVEWKSRRGRRHWAFRRAIIKEKEALTKRTTEA